MAKTLSSLTLCLLLAPLAGCDQIVEALNKGAQSAAENAAGGGEVTEDDKLGQKLQGYIDCINNHSSRVHDSVDYYLKWIEDPAVGPTGKETNIYTPYEISHPQTCADGVKTSADAEPEDADLEAAGTAFAETLVETAALINDAHKYYDEKNYKDDGFAKGKELHPKLMAAYEKFSAADKKLREIVGTQNDALQERELASVEKEMGKSILWYNKKVMILSKKLMNAGDVEVTPELKLDLEAFDPLLKEFETVLEEAQTYAKANKAETDSVTMYSSFLDAAEQMKKTAKELARRKRDGTGFTKEELDRVASGWNFDSIEGSPAKLSKDYNDLVGSSNRLSWNWYKPPGSAG
jgi:hypothetical protein